MAAGDHLWSCSRDLSIKQWNHSSGDCVQTINDAHTLNVAGISYNEGKGLVTAHSHLDVI